MSKYDWLCYQFISLNGTRSAFDSSDLDVNKDDSDGESKDSDSKWTDHIMPKGKQIRTVETLLGNSSGRL